MQTNSWRSNNVRRPHTHRALNSFSWSGLLIGLAGLACLLSLSGTIRVGDANEHELVHVALVSSKVSEQVVASQILQVALTSFTAALKVNEKVEVELGVYLECSEVVLAYPVAMHPEIVAYSHIPHVTSVIQTITQFRSKFTRTQVYCSSTLASILCYRARRSMGLKSSSKREQPKTEYLFLFEHDWIFFPSQVPASLDTLIEQVRSGVTENILLQRGDRNIGEKLMKSTAPLYRTDSYSNNPFLSSPRFLRLLVEEGMCSNNERSGKHWERQVVNMCRREAHACKLSVLVPEGTSSKASCYHADYRFLGVAMNHSLGPLFAVASEAPVKDFMLGLKEPMTVVEYLDKRCNSREERICKPYYIREIFSQHLQEYALTSREKFAHLEELISNYAGDTFDTDQLLVGHFPGKQELVRNLGK